MKKLSYSDTTQPHWFSKLKGIHYFNRCYFNYIIFLVMLLYCIFHFIYTCFDIFFVNDIISLFWFTEKMRLIEDGRCLPPNTYRWLCVPVTPEDVDGCSSALIKLNKREECFVVSKASQFRGAKEARIPGEFVAKHAKTCKSSLLLHFSLFPWVDMKNNKKILSFIENISICPSNTQCIWTHWKPLSKKK